MKNYKVVSQEQINRWLSRQFHKPVLKDDTQTDIEEETLNSYDRQAFNFIHTITADKKKV